MEALHRQMVNKLAVPGCPGNDLGQQESGTHEEIRQFCDTTYQATFPLTAKIHVKGEEQHPLYRWLTMQELNGQGHHAVTWNFQKFLVDENGRLQAVYAPATWPLNEALLQRLL